MKIRFTATSDDYETEVFQNEDQFISYLDRLWSTNSWGRRYQAEKLWNPEPESYPCIMLVSGTSNNSDGPDWIHNVFLYDVDIIEGEDEDQDSQIETA